MRNLTVKTVYQIECNLTPNQWQLYYKPERDTAASELNKAFADAVNAGKDAREVWLTMRPVMNRWEEVGACDSEGHDMLELLTATVFGREAGK